MAEHWNYSGLPPVEKYDALVDRVNALNSDVAFAAEVIAAFLAFGICPSGYDFDDLKAFVGRLMANR